jgi:hypothetical protein
VLVGVFFTFLHFVFLCSMDWWALFLHFYIFTFCFLCSMGNGGLVGVFFYIFTFCLFVFVLSKC